jgi:hypothetical protein
MSTLDDLRTTLDRHASGLPDDHLSDRTGAVRERVRVVRRRRRAGAAGALAVVLAVVGGVVLGLDSPHRHADRRLAGATAPAALRSLGYTYAFARGVEGDGAATLRLPASEQPRLVSWATASSDDVVTLRGVGDEPRTVTVDDFGDFVRVPPGRRGAITVTGTGEVALAAYDLRRAAPGDTVDGVTFREEVAGQRLLASAIGTPGQAEVSVDLSTDAGPLPVSYLCAAGPVDAWVHISLNGEQVVSGGGCEDSLFDPAGAGGFSTDLGAVEARSTRLRLWVTHGEHGGRVEDADLRVGLGAYAPAPSVARLAGSPVPATVEHDGHLWRFVDARPGAGRELEVRGLPGRETLVGMRFASVGRGVVRTLANGVPAGSSFRTGGSGYTEAVVPATGGTVGLRVSESARRGGIELGLVRYVRAD